MPDWLLPTFLLLPALLWMFGGVGIPWALALLPSADWSRQIEVLTLAIALGAALTTTAMFVIGTIGHFTLLNTLISTGIIAAIGWVLASCNRGSALSPAPKSQTLFKSLTAIDGALIFVIAVAVVLRFWNTAYWPYNTYDEFWVYGYNAKIFMIQGAIPASMGYYPQLLPLSLTYSQLAWGSLSEHAARTVVPYFGLGSILMMYVLGTRLFNRRTGLIAAAIWGSYAHHAEWSQYADLEVPTTFYFTGAAAFFILSWRDRNARYALIGGVLAGAALWTKPTAGALIESVALIGAIIMMRALFIDRQHSSLHDRLHQAVRVIAGTPIPLFMIALIPMGGMWYVRNILYGHPPIVLPAGYWQDAAQRSGQELGWPLLTLITLAAFLLMQRRLNAMQQRAIMGGVLLMLIGALPSAMDAHRLSALEYAVISAGGGLFIYGAWAWWRALHSATRSTITLLYAFIIPYFVTWFWSYSYHFRLSFAIVPLFAVQVAAGLDRLCSPIVATKRFRVALAVAAILIGALPGWSANLSAWGVAINGSLADDHAKQAIANPALLHLVDFLNAHHDPTRPLTVEASGELRLPFFFPNDDMRVTDYPTRLDQIADVDYFVDSSVGQRLYLIAGSQYNQILSSLNRDSVFQRKDIIDDHNFRFWTYTVDNKARFIAPKPNGTFDIDPLQIGDFARLVGYDLSTLQNSPGEKVFLTLYWQALKPSAIDYSVYIHLWDAQSQTLRGQWGGEPMTGAYSLWQGVQGDHPVVAYHTRLWQAGEYIKDEWVLKLAKDTPPGSYDLRIGLFDLIGGARLPVQINGVQSGDGVHLVTFTVQPPS